MRLCTVLTFLILSHLTFCQVPSWQWGDRLPYLANSGYPYGTSKVDRFGNFFSLVQADTTSFISKRDTKGSLVWQKSISGKIYGLTVDKDGNCYIVGNSSDCGYFVPDKNSNGLLFKFDPYGALMWQKIIPVKGSGILSIESTVNGIVIAGTVHDSTEAFMLAGYSLAGNLQWTLPDNTSNWQDPWWVAERIAIVKDGSIAFVYWSNNVYSLAKLDVNRQFVSKVTLGSESPYGLCFDKNHNIYVSLSFHMGASTSWGRLRKYSPSLGVVWEIQTHSGQSGDYTLVSEPEYCTMDSAIYISGYVGNWNGGTNQVVLGDDTLKLKGLSDAIIVRVNPANGKIIESYHAGGKSNDWIISLASDYLGNLYTLGGSKDSLCLDTHCMLTLDPFQYNLFVGKLKRSDMEFTDAVGIKTTRLESFQVFPNPTTDRLTIMRTSTVPSNATIFDGNGKIQFETFLTEKTKEIDVSFLKSGVYQLSLLTEQDCHYHSFLIIR